MKAKLIQVLLGAAGSVISILVTYFAGLQVDPVAAGVAGGAVANVALGDAIQNLTAAIG